MILDRIVLSSHFRYSLLYRGQQNNEIVIIGNSRGVNSFYVPEIEKLTGMRALNLSYNGLWGEICEVIFLDYLENNHKPKILIIEITSFAKKQGKVINDLKIYSSHSPRLRECVQRVSPKEYIWSKACHLYRYNSEMFLRTLYYLDKQDQSWINRYSINPSLLEYISDSPEEFMLSTKENIEALKRIIYIAHEKRIDVRLIVGPYLPAYAERVPNLQNWILQMQTNVGPEYRIWDYSTAINDPMMFADRVHLNYDGSIYFLNNLINTSFFKWSN